MLVTMDKVKKVLNVNKNSSLKRSSSKPGQTKNSVFHAEQHISA